MNTKKKNNCTNIESESIGSFRMPGKMLSKLKLERELRKKRKGDVPSIVMVMIKHAVTGLVQNRS